MVNRLESAPPVVVGDDGIGRLGLIGAVALPWSRWRGRWAVPRPSLSLRSSGSSMSEEAAPASSSSVLCAFRAVVSFPST